MVPTVAMSVFFSTCDSGMSSSNHEDHGPGGKGQGVGQNRPDENDRRRPQEAGYGLDHCRQLAEPEALEAGQAFSPQGNGDRGPLREVLNPDAQG
jgi:hypothetical protein